MLPMSKFLNKLTNLSLLDKKSFADSAKFLLQPYKLHRLESGPTNETTCTKEDALHYLRQMHQIRRMETACSNLYKEKEIRGFCHLSTGQEAVAVGIEAGLIEADSIITSYRCHGFTMTRGATIHQVIAELMGKKTGVTKGIGGSMHMYGRNFYGGNGIVGAQVPLGAGLALAHKYKKDNGMNIALFGDGAANQGQVYEAFNMAKIWELPCVFVCENNHYGMGTSAQRASANINYYTRGDAIPGVWVDGMDVLSVREALRFCGEWCRSGKGPLVLEMETYRYVGHSMSDPGTSYRTKEEVKSVRKERDPISHFTKSIISAGLTTEEEVKKLEKEVRAEVDEAANQARKDPFPELDTAYKNIYTDSHAPIRGCNVDSWIHP